MPDQTSATVAFDASLWDEPTTGIGLYTHRLARGLEALGVTLRRMGARQSGEAPRGGRNATLFTLGRLPALLQRDGARLYHAVCNFNLPLVRIPGCAFVLTVHDLIPELLPETVSARFRWQFRLWLGRSLRVADRVICVSERSRTDLLARHEVAPERVTTIPLGVDHLDEVPALDPAGRAYLAALGLPRDFVLYAGAIDARKNIELVLDACVALRRAGRPLTLVLAGQRWFGAGGVERRIAQLRAEGLDVRPLGYQSEPVFYELMRRASVFVFPSRYEGFGLPPLEAMRLGTPAIVSDRGALPEVCAPGAIVVPADDSRRLADELTQLVSSPEHRRAVAARGQEHARGYSWRETARRTLAVYEEALSEAGR